MGGENDDYEIVVYKLKHFSTGRLLHMIQFYLLMRASRQLAGEYCAQIFGDGWPVLLNEVETRSQFESNSDFLEGSNTDEDLAEALAAGYNDDICSVHEVAYPEQEAGWKEEWGHQRQDAIRRCGPGPLMGFEPVEAECWIPSATSIISILRYLTAYQWSDL
ncbi:hypothetical protein FS749_016736 [Ceratobasidium sp. UAMH 11750]|nr:hypothetical protein FS749_016736 [Ceratobasidium sp. UAMH 11750]